MGGTAPVPRRPTVNIGGEKLGTTSGHDVPTSPTRMGGRMSIDRSPKATSHIDADAFLAGAGEMGDLFRRKDWASTPLGDLDCLAAESADHHEHLLELPVPDRGVLGTRVFDALQREPVADGRRS